MRYQKNNQIDEKLKKYELGLKSQSQQTIQQRQQEIQKIKDALRTEMGNQVLLLYGYNGLKKFIQAGYKYQALSQLARHPVNAMFTDDDGQLYIHYTDNTYEVLPKQ